MSNIPKIIFIVPYRDRLNEKQHFSIYMKYIMEDYEKNDYEIYYSHQKDNRLFNRGATKNIGFLVMKERYPNDYKNITFVFNDIDTLPCKKNMFNYITQKGTVKHFYGFTFTLGGIVSMNGEDFETCNGFPNNWGWGLEDNILYDRANQQSLIINREQFVPYNSKSVIHLYDSPNRIISNREALAYANKQTNDNLNTITNLNYTIVNNDANSNDAKSNDANSNDANSNDANSNDANKVSNIEQNEYIIDIHQFQTLLNVNSNTYYTQNVLEQSSILPKRAITIVKRDVKPRWLLNKNYR